MSDERIADAAAGLRRGPDRRVGIGPESDKVAIWSFQFFFRLSKRDFKVVFPSSPGHCGAVLHKFYADFRERSGV